MLLFNFDSPNFIRDRLYPSAFRITYNSVNKYILLNQIIFSTNKTFLYTNNVL